MKKIGSLLHSERSKSLKAYAWDQIDRTYFYKDAQDAMDVSNSSFFCDRPTSGMTADK